VTIRVARGAVGQVVREEHDQDNATQVDDGEVSEEN
jgi:hypothetical protein